MTDALPKTAEGRMGKIDTGTRMFGFRPDGGFGVDIFWSPNQDEKIGKFKEKYKAKVTYETDKQGKHWLTDVISTYKPDDRTKGSSPQDQILIAKEVVFKALTELKWETFNPEKETYDTMCEDIIRNFELVMPRFLKAGDGK